MLPATPGNGMWMKVIGCSYVCYALSSLWHFRACPCKKYLSLLLSIFSNLKMYQVEM